MGDLLGEPAALVALAERLMLLVEGAIVTAYVEGDQSAATRARSAAAALWDCTH